MIKVARLQSEFCTKDFFWATNFLTKNAPKFSPKFLSLCSVGQKKSRKIPSKFPTQFSKVPCEKAKKIHRRASAGAQGEVLKWICVMVAHLLHCPGRKKASQRESFPARYPADVLGSFVRTSPSEGRKWGVRSVVVEFGVFGSPRVRMF